MTQIDQKKTGYFEQLNSFIIIKNRNIERDNVII